jgi:hypothetical protein
LVMYATSGAEFVPRQHNGHGDFVEGDES